VTPRRARHGTGRSHLGSRAVAPAVCLLAALGAACGGGDDGDAAGGSASGAGGASSASASQAFCDSAAEFEQATAAATGIASADEMQSAVDQLNDVAAEAPEQMDDEFAVLVGVLERLVTAMRSVGEGDAAATVEAMQKVLTPDAAAQVEDASRNVEAFLEVECGIEDEAAGPSATAPAAPPTSTAPGDPAALGTDPTLGRLATACHDGDMVRCDELYFASPPGSPYETYGDTCGMRTTVDEFCVDVYPPATTTTEPAG
jgi:hypothetical protein